MPNETITLGAGCFWCVEAIFQSLSGVVEARSGYSGGDVVNPSYREVCTGRTGHAEVVQVVYNPKIIRLDQILDIFWQTHDPTTLNRQGADVGTQYRSAIFYHNEEQKQIAEESKRQANEKGLWNDPIVTEITAYKNFFEAGEDHEDYYNRNKEQPYCLAVIRPKMEKFRDKFGDMMG